MVEISTFPPNPQNNAISNEFLWVFSGSLSTLQNNLLPKFSRPVDVVISSLVVYLQEAPVGEDVIITFLKNAVSIGTVTVVDGAVYGINTLATQVTVLANDIMTVQITQIGTTSPGTTATMIARLA